ncbi:hypothetical protein [Hymenobacter volaticus]|uniref:Uncharacterized protein n=1 Tax=Hymenobacter volaticus TaxID=2932254 RepID=A0ABY4GEP5_9BACT|nr:hypothetical protein [Hymenobacter volaticus]UOQ69281.1 hypothetical protein MUN86_27910 [Hymenobacter volaticus]UOQ69308.1 hypothetical protein MUN86_26785 [Hymenobacter volaticus]
MHAFLKAKERELSILKDDYTELWFLGAEIHTLYPEASLPELQQVTQHEHVIRDLMREQAVQLLDPGTELPVSSSEERVREMTGTLFPGMNRLPTIGDGIWLGILPTHE